MKEVGKGCGRKSVSEIPPRGRRVGGRWLGLRGGERRCGDETGSMAGLVGCVRAAGDPGPAGEGS